MTTFSGLYTEVKHSHECGMEQLTMATLDARLAELGYKRESDSRCTCIARNLTTGNSYPCVTYGVKESDTGMSAFHFEARRDDKFKALQALRFNAFAVVRGQYVSI